MLRVLQKNLASLFTLPIGYKMTRCLSWVKPDLPMFSQSRGVRVPYSCPLRASEDALVWKYCKYWAWFLTETLMSALAMKHLGLQLHQVRLKQKALDVDVSRN